LARDLRYLAGRGYTIGSVQPFDMFPQTGHVETLVTLTRK
jgi:23S rRNA (uracil1939-C5)-methyltransferase